MKEPWRWLKKLSFESLKRSYEGYDLPIKAGAAILNKVEQRLEFIDFTEAIKENNFDRLIDDYILPEYEILITGAKQKAVQKQEAKNKKNINTLRWLFWIILPLLGLALILLDAFGVFILHAKINCDRRCSGDYFGSVL